MAFAMKKIKDLETQKSDLKLFAALESSFYTNKKASNKRIE